MISRGLSLKRETKLLEAENHTRKFSIPNGLTDTQRSEEPPRSRQAGRDAKAGGGDIGTAPPAKGPQKRTVNYCQSPTRRIHSRQSYLFPTHRGQVGPIRNWAGRTKGGSRMTENESKRKAEEEEEVGRSGGNAGDVGM